MTLLGWLASIILCVGLYQTGERKRLGFVFAIVGECIWTAIALHRSMYDLAFVCAIFAILAVRNWFAWGVK